MKKSTRILSFTLMLTLAFLAIAGTGIAADDIQDFIGKEEQLACNEWPVCDEQLICNERPIPLPARGSLSYNGRARDEYYIEGNRLETRFDLAPALQGGATTSRLQSATQSMWPVAQEQISATQETAEKIEPISDFIPPPNTGRDSYFVWGVLGVVILLGAALPGLRKKARR